MLALAGAVTIATSVRALDAERGLSQYLRDRWGSESGFPGGPVYAIAQTSDGYLWIGAEKGLVRFDGLTFRLMDAGSGAQRRASGARRGRRRGWQPVGAAPRHRPRPPSRAASSTTCWADQGAPRSVVTAMARGKDGVMLLATLAHGALAYRGGRFDPVTVPGELPSFVISIAEAANGELWLGSRDAGILRVRGAHVSRHVDGLPDLKINCLLATPAGEVWIGTDRGVARWNGTEITQTGVPAALRATPALSLTRDRDKNLWVAAGAGGLLRVDSRRQRCTRRPRPGRPSDT